MSGISEASRRLIHHGAIVRVTITHQPHHPTAFRSQELDGLGLPAKDQISAHLLIDTGAAHTMVEQRIIDQIGADPIDEIFFVGVGGRISCMLYTARLMIDTRAGKMILDTTIAAAPAMLPHGALYQGLLGRSSLQKVKLIYDGAAGTFDLLQR